MFTASKEEYFMAKRIETKANANAAEQIIPGGEQLTAHGSDPGGQKAVVGDFHR